MIEMVEIEQIFNDQKLENIQGKIQTEIRNNPSVQSLQRSSKVAITAGSRGISNIVTILREIVNTLRGLSLEPFLVPAMGSHGGGTAEGQLEVLQHIGITEESIGAPIYSSMEVELIGHTEKGVPVYMDKIAYNADAIMVVNRVKAHTAFRGRVESGLSKMITIGLGKIKGATFVHSNGALKMAENIESVSKCALENSKILMGLAIVENGYDQTTDIVGVKKEEWHQKEEELLQLSKNMMPSLPLEEIELLIVEEIGKGFSGTGMDPNIIGRWRITGVPEPRTPRIERIGVLNIADSSFGNAQGIGLADFTTKFLVDKVDRKSTYTNALTSTYLMRAMLPLIYDTEKELFTVAAKSLGPEVDVASIKMVQIPNTLHLKRVYLSKAAFKELENTERNYKVIGEHRLKFDDQGRIVQRLTAEESAHS